MYLRFALVFLFSIPLTMASQALATFFAWKPTHREGLLTPETTQLLGAEAPIYKLYNKFRFISLVLAISYISLFWFSWFLSLKTLP